MWVRMGRSLKMAKDKPRQTFRGFFISTYIAVLKFQVIQCKKNAKEKTLNYHSDSIA